MSTNGQLVFTDVDKITFKGVGNTSNAVVDTVTGKIGVGIDNPDANLHVLGNSYVSTNLELGGTLIMGTVNVEAQHSLEAITATGNTTPLTVEFSNATTGIVTTSNVEVGGELTVSGNVEVSGELTVSGNVEVGGGVVSNVNLLSVSNVASIKMDSNVVAEYTGPHNRPLRKYPEVPMTSNNNSSTSGYFVAQSYYSTNSFDTRKAWNLFNHVTSGAADGGYHALKLGLHYSQTDGTYNHTPAESLGGVNGPWLYIRLPKKISLDHVKLISRAGFPQRVPRSATFLGSNNGTNWENIFSFSDVNLIGDSSSGEHTYTYNVNSTVKYEYFGFVWEKMGVEPLNSFINMEELELYGYEEGSGSLDTTLKTVYNVPATTGTQLEVYYDAKGESTVQSPIPDLSPNTNTGDVAGHSPTLDTTDGIESFNFNGSSSYINGGTTPISGNQHHSFSCWLKPVAANSGNYRGIGYVVNYAVASASRNNTTTGLFLKNNQPVFLTWGNNLESGYTLPINEWVHITTVYDGTGRTIYVNSKNIDSDTYSSYNINASGTLIVGASSTTADSGPGEVFGGSIANFRLYSKALNADQIKELYDYQKDYFFGSKSQVTLYKGHLGVGVTEPSGQLELAGDERIEEYPPRGMTGYDTLIEGHGTFRVLESSSFTVSATEDYLGWEAFDKNLDTIVYMIGDSYDASSGNYTGNHRLSSETEKGAYLVLEMPYKIYPKQVLQYARNNNANKVNKAIYYGKADPGDPWTVIHNQNTPAPSASEPYRGIINSDVAYQYLAIVVTNGATTVAISNLAFYGTPGPTTLDKGSLTLGRSLDVPRVSRYDVDTETPRPEKLILDYDTTVNSSPTDISGRGSHGSFSGNASYSAADKAFNFTGASTSDMIVGSMPTSSGDNTLSVSFWYKRTSTTGIHCPVRIGDTSQGQAIAMDIYNNGTVYWFIYSGKNFSWTSVSDTWFPLNIWTHVVCVHTAGTDFANLNEVYINGVPQSSTATFGGNAVDLSLDAGSDTVVIGARSTGTNHAIGQISKFKVYSVTLEHSEVQKLYRLGRTGRSMVISDTAVGIGKAPEAQLDVRGVIRGPGLTIQTVSSYKSDTTIFAGTSVTDISGLSVTIQPKFANSQILVSYDVNMGGKGRVFLRVKRVQGSSTTYFWSDQGSGGWTQSPGGGAATSTYAGTNTDAEVNGYPFKRLDNAGGLNPITYTVQGWSNHSVYNVCINRAFVDTSAAGHGGASYWGRCVSSITAQEVCQ